MPQADETKPVPAPTPPASAKVTDVPTHEPKSTVTEVPQHMQHENSGSRDETVPGGMTVQRINNGRHFQVQNADGVPIPGKVFDPQKGAIVEG